MSKSPNPFEDFHSGMAIPSNDLRVWMSEQYDRTYDEWHTNYGYTFRIERAADYFRRIHTVGSIELVEESDFTLAQRDYQAGHYVFGKRLLEPWAAPGFKMPPAFEYTPLPFLREHGYELKARPAAGDVVAYSFHQNEDELHTEIDAFSHYGILNEDGRVTSKFGVGDVLSHKIDEVPSVSGRFVHFLARTAVQSA